LRAALGEAVADPGAKFETVPVPGEFLKIAGSPRNSADGDPRWSYRYDQEFWFGESIRRGESRSPSFVDGLACQRVLDAVLDSSARGSWVAAATPSSLARDKEGT
jgi:hypothetical protein